MNLFGNLMKMKYSFSPVLHNQFVLYFLLFFALVDLFYFVTIQDYSSAVTFVLVGFLTSFFSKNMIVILFFAMTLTHIVRVDREPFTYSKNEIEGMSNKEDEVETTTESSATPTMTPAKTAELKQDLDDFTKLQEKVIKNLNELNPLLAEAETFINKFESYRKTE